MLPSQDIRPITTLKTAAARLVKDARERGTPVVITQNGLATAVLMDIDSYERLTNAVAMLKLIELARRSGRAVPQRSVMARLRRRFGQVRRAR